MTKQFTDSASSLHGAQPNDVFEPVYDLDDKIAKLAERWENRLTWKGLVFSEEYLKGNLMIVVELELRFEGIVGVSSGEQPPEGVVSLDRAPSKVRCECDLSGSKFVDDSTTVMCRCDFDKTSNLGKWDDRHRGCSTRRGAMT